MTKIEIVKTVGKFVISVGVGTIISDAIKATTSSKNVGLKKLCVFVGGIVLGGMISESAITYAEKQVDEVVKGIKTKEEDKTEKEKEN